MKVRHFPAALGHSPGFVIRHGVAMLRHTFAGSTLRSLVGLEDERRTFERFRAIRRRERDAASRVDLPDETPVDNPDGIPLLRHRPTTRTM